MDCLRTRQAPPRRSSVSWVPREKRRTRRTRVESDGLGQEWSDRRLRARAGVGRGRVAPYAMGHAREAAYSPCLCRDMCLREDSFSSIGRRRPQMEPNFRAHPWIVAKRTILSRSSTSGCSPSSGGSLLEVSGIVRQACSRTPRTTGTREGKRSAHKIWCTQISMTEEVPSAMSVWPRMTGRCSATNSYPFPKPHIPETVM